MYLVKTVKNITLVGYLVHTGERSTDTLKTLSKYSTYLNY